MGKQLSEAIKKDKLLTSKSSERLHKREHLGQERVHAVCGMRATQAEARASLLTGKYIFTCVGEVEK